MGTCLRMEVLFELRESRKTLITTKDNIVFVIEEELGKVGVDGVLAYFSCPQGERRHGSKDVYILQRWTDKWKSFVDVTDIDQIQDGDRLTVIKEIDLYPQTHPAGDQQGSTFDASRGHVSIPAQYTAITFNVFFVKISWKRTACYSFYVSIGRRC